MAEKLRLYRQAQPRPGKALTGLAARSLEEEVKGSLGGATSIMQRFARSMTRDIKASVATATVNAYAPKWLKFKEWCEAHEEIPLPAQEVTIAAYLSSASDQDKTFSATKKRRAAVAFYHNLHDHPSPCNGALVSRVMKGIRRRTGSAGKKKAAVSYEDVLAVQREATRSGDASEELVADWTSIMHEGQFRFDDAHGMNLGDLVFEQYFVRILVVDTKSDKDREGQWGLLAVSSDPQSAYQRLIALILRGITRFRDLPRETRRALRLRLAQNQCRPFREPGSSAIATIPREIAEAANNAGLTNELLENLPLMGTWLWGKLEQSGDLRSVMNYRPFLGTLKALFERATEHSAAEIGTHSMRRGGTTGKIAAGVDDRLVKFLGRWRSETTFAGYIDARTTAKLCAEAIERTRPEPQRR